MKKKRHTVEQIIRILREADSGLRNDEVCLKHNISQQTFYRWKRRFAGMGVTELRKLKQLEEENRRLKRLVADLTLDKQMLQEVVSKKV